MCGPLAACVSRGDRRRAWRYHLGRVVGYGFIGAIAGASGAHLATLISARWLTTLAAATAALVLLTAALWELRPRARTPDASRLVTIGDGPVPRSSPSRLSLLASRLGLRRLGNSAASCGSLTVFLPCGVLWAAVAIAAGTRSWIVGAAAMAFFAVATGLAVAGLATIIWRVRRVFGRRALAAFFALGGIALAVLSVASFIDGAARDDDSAVSCPFHPDDSTASASGEGAGR